MRRIFGPRPPARRPSARFRPRLDVLEDRCLPSTFLVTNIGDSGPGSLRQAILDSNATPGSNTIDFNIAPGGAQTIQPLSVLPTVTNPVVIDGTSQPGFAGTPIIELDGSLAGPADGLLIQTNDSTVRGLVINRFVGAPNLGIGIYGSNNRVQGNYIGTNVAGTAIFPLGQQISYDVSIFGGAGNVIGTDGDGVNDAAEGNVLSGAASSGLLLENGASGNVIAGNRIGTNADGSAALGNGQYGVFFDGAGPGNRIGTNSDGVSDTLERNIISGNGLRGIIIDSDGNVVAGNYIGTDAAGTAALPNGTLEALNGVLIAGGSNNLVGGTAPGAGNVISGNDGIGLELNLSSAVGNVVEGNFIGTDATGTNPLGNSLEGVWISANSNNNVIGGTASGQANTIAFNGRAGVTVTENSSVGNSIRGNSIFANQALGIDLGGSGVPVQNDSQGHAGPNNFQNFPVLSNAIAEGNGTTRVIGTFSEAAEPNTTITLDFYANAAADPSGYGQGQTYLGSGTVTTDASGNAHFSMDLNVATMQGQVVSATATDPAGNTSEFSADETEVGPRSPSTPAAPLVQVPPSFDYIPAAALTSQTPAPSAASTTPPALPVGSKPAVLAATLVGSAPLLQSDLGANQSASVTADPQVLDQLFADLGGQLSEIL